MEVSPVVSAGHKQAGHQAVIQCLAVSSGLFSVALCNPHGEANKAGFPDGVGTEAHSHGKRVESRTWKDAVAGHGGFARGLSL